MDQAFDPHALATRLLSEHRAQLAKAVSRQMCELVPRYFGVEEADREQTTDAVLLGVERLLRGEGQGKMLVAVDEAFERRAAEGFTPPELILATHSYLPVIRQIFCEHAGDLREGLAAYEQIETAILPLLRHVIELAFETRTATDPGFTRRPRATASGELPTMPALAEPDDDEATFS